MRTVLWFDWSIDRLEPRDESDKASELGGGSVLEDASRFRNSYLGLRLIGKTWPRLHDRHGNPWLGRSHETPIRNADGGIRCAEFW